MNIVQQHERIRFLLDQVASTRFESEDIDNAINGEIDLIVNEKYDKSRFKNKGDAFQITQRVRDELASLIVTVEDGDGFDISGNTINIETTDYRHLLSLKVEPVEDAGWYNCYPLTYDQKNVIPKNPFRRLRSTIYPKLYYIEEASKTGDMVALLVMQNISANLYDAEISYLKNPTIVNYGVEYDDDESFSSGAILIAVEQTVYDGTTYVIGEKFTVGGVSSITSGLVVHNFVETELPVSLHEDICNRAASSLLISAGESEKAKEILIKVF